VGGSGSVTDHSGDVIRDHGAVEIHLPKRAHHLVHIHVTIIHEGFHKMRQGRIDVTEMDLENLTARAKVLDGLQQTLARILTSFQPGAATEAHSNVGAAGNFQSALEAIEVPKNAAGNPAQNRQGWIIRMNAD